MHSKLTLMTVIYYLNAYICWLAVVSKPSSAQYEKSPFDVLVTGPGKWNYEVYVENILKKRKERSIPAIEVLNRPISTNLTHIDGTQFQSNFSKYSCHYIVNNYNNNNIKFVIYPVIIRRLVLAKFEKGINRMYPYIWVPHGLRNESEIANLKDSAINCRKSKYLSDFDGNHQSPDLCVRLKLPMYSAQSKPWNCQVELHLQPLPLLLEHVKYPRSFQITRSESFDSLRVMLPSVRPTFVILVDSAHKYTLHQVKEWLSSSTNGQYGQPEDDATPLVTYTEFVYVKIRTNFILNAYTLRSDIYRFPQTEVHLRSFGPELIEHMDKGKDEEFNQGWAFDKAQGYTMFYDQAIRFHLDECGNKAFEHVNRAKFPNGRNAEFNSQLYRGVMLMLLSIWRNYTFDASWHICINGINANSMGLYFNHPNHWTDVPTLKTHIVDPNRTLYYPLSFNDSLQTIKFISCGGSNGVEGIAFKEIYGVFDVWIWICIAVSICVVSVSLSWTLNKGKNAETRATFRFWHSVKLYLEQNGPYPEYVNMKSKPIIATTLLVGIVLSNAYKNANVYNMILPREIVPFTDVTELVSHQFSIYTKPLYMKCPSDKCFNDNAWVETKFKNLNKDCITTQHSVTCEEQNGMGTQDIMKVDSHLIDVRNKNGFNAKTKNGNDIKDLATLTPMQNVYDGMIKYFDFLDPEFASWDPGILLLAALRESGESVLFELLKSCNKTAAVVSEYLARRFEQQLKRENFKNVFVGKDRYLDANQGFYLKGKMHRNVAKRITALKFSGIWDWWPKYTIDRFYFDGERSEKTLHTPSMEGNIQIIFYLLVAGLTISVIVHIGETFLQIVSLVKIGFHVIPNLIWRAVVKVSKCRCDIKVVIRFESTTKVEVIDSSFFGYLE